MVTARALGLLASDPQRAHVALHALRGLVGVPPSADGAGIGSCVDAAALLTRKPVIAAGSTFAELVGPQKGRTAVVQVRTAEDVRPSTESPGNLGPWRHKSYACAVIGGPKSADEAGRLHDKLVSELPDFLRRSVKGKTEAEAFFFAVLAELQQQGMLDRPPTAEAVVGAVRAVIHSTDELPRHVVIANGTGLWLVSHEMRSGIVRMDGLDQEVALSLDPALSDSSLARERLKRFRCVVTAGGLDAALEGGAWPKVSGVQLLDLSETCAVEIGRDFEPRRL